MGYALYVIYIVWLGFTVAAVQLSIGRQRRPLTPKQALAGLAVVLLQFLIVTYFYLT